MRTVSSPVMEAEARRHRQQPIPGNRSSELSCRRRSPLSLSLFLVFPTRRRFLPFSSSFLSPSFGLNNCDGPRVDINLRAIICLFSLPFPSSFFLSSPLLRKSNPSTSLIGLFETGISVRGEKEFVHLSILEEGSRVARGGGGKTEIHSRVIKD